MRALCLAWLLASAWLALGCAPEPPCRELYRPCTSDAQCPEEARCGTERWEFGSGDLCQRPCEDLRDCPRAGGHDGLCLDLQRDGTFFCYRGCLTTDECPIGWVCQPYTSSESQGGVCLP